ncbi:TetR/AcrR family transcriptional regulator [Nocardia blacklockiae]|uniref:TetR/AcrR family transcriptional regulator n=1 Tax=Nocardia blacklockiae TaxID=480036 RepID=UPI0018950230|nr:TetR/AcrR family transcriptional regulator [Nocardia blacklockiae]MBF6175565.1 TetR/AcrR family transcriptional regulator [Nocardia blacklockiae]
MSSETGPRPGRPLSTETDRAVREATLTLLAEVGYAGLRVQEVADRAGVGKAALYRRWPSKAALALHHLIGDLRPREYRDTGSLRGDIREVARDFVARMGHPRVRSVLPEMMVDLLHDRALHSVFEEVCLLPEQDLIHRVAARAMERGELAALPDLRWAHAQFAGPVFLWLHLLGGENDPALADRVANSVAAAWLHPEENT